MRKQVIINGEKTHYEIYDDGRVVNTKNNNTLKGSIQHGYKSYYLTGNGWKKAVSAHRLVAEAFLDNPENLPVVHHKNGDKLDNRVENLEWVSYSKNSTEIIRTVPRTNKRPKYAYYEGEIASDEAWAQFRDTNYYLSNYGRLWNRENNRILKPHEDAGGYLYYTITIKKKTQKMLAHRGVYESFHKVVLRREEQIDHIDGDRRNNKFENLRIASSKENNIYKAERKKESNGYIIKQFTLDGELVATYQSIADAARAVGVVHGSISGCVNGKCPTIKGFKWEKVILEEGSTTN